MLAIIFFVIIMIPLAFFKDHWIDPLSIRWTEQIVDSCFQNISQALQLIVD